jgi:prophage regulatory protein
MAFSVTPLTSLLRIREVLRTTGDSRSGLYGKIKQGKFPKPIKLGPRQSVWIASEVEAFIQSRIAASRGGGQ